METYRDILSGRLDIYLSSVSNRVNEVVKALTSSATSFMPRTFPAGLYGMNFEYLPELEWHYGYFAVVVFMVLVSGCVVLYFKRKWI